MVLYLTTIYNIQKMKISKENRRKQQDEKGRKKRQMPISGRSLKQAKTKEANKHAR